MYCKVCRRFDNSGKRNVFRDDAKCSSFRYRNVTAHRDSDVHKIAIRACEESKQDVSERPIEKQLTKLNNEQIIKIKKYFSTSFYLAQFNKPYAGFRNLMDLQLHNFADNDLDDSYTSYKSDKKCREFINYIAADILEKLVQTKLDDDSFISILVDGSTDKANIEQEMVYICMLQNNKRVTQFVNLVSVPKANAENITVEIVKTLTDKLKLQNWTNTMSSTKLSVGFYLGINCPGRS